MAVSLLVGNHSVASSASYANLDMARKEFIGRADGCLGVEGFVPPSQCLEGFDAVDWIVAFLVVAQFQRDIWMAKTQTYPSGAQPLSLVVGPKGESNH